MSRFSILDMVIAVVAAIAIAVSAWSLLDSEAEVEISHIDVGKVPATVYRPSGASASPVLVIAHGFAGSQQLMQPIAIAAANNGYIAMTFDFAGHGKSLVPMTGDITTEDGATATLVDELQRVVETARTLGNGKVAVLGHSMASDIAIRVAQARPDIGATIAVSMFSPVVDGSSPENLLIIVGEWEARLTEEALRVVGLTDGIDSVEPNTTYGNPKSGVSRRLAISPHVEHASILFSQYTMTEVVQWLDESLGPVRPPGPLDIPARGGWIILFFVGVVALGKPLSSLLPRLAGKAPMGAAMTWRRAWLPMLAPMVLTPPLLVVIPTGFLPILVGDYLAVHFAVYGILTAICIRYVQRKRKRDGISHTFRAPFVIATAAVIAYGFVALVWPIHTFVTSFMPGPGRGFLLAVLVIGTLFYFVTAEWMTRGPGAGRFIYPSSIAAFLASLVFAVILDFEGLFFLLIAAPVILLFFFIYGLFSTWIYRRTGNPLVAGVANAIAVAWAIGVTFPLLAG